MEDFMLKIESEAATAKSKYPELLCFRIKLPVMREDGALYSCVDKKTITLHIYHS